jgi:hypothetical protein
VALGKQKGICNSRVDVYIHKAAHRKGGIYTEKEFNEKVEEYEVELLGEGATFDQLVHFREAVRSAPVIAGGFRKVEDV